MTHIEEIFLAAKKIYLDDKKHEFTRNDIKNMLGLTTQEWDMGYTGDFQGMINGVPPLKNKIRPKYRDVFVRVKPTIYTFSEKGISLLNIE